MDKDMKTEQEIKEWLVSRHWFKKFKRNLEKEAKLHQELQKSVDSILEGKYGFSTISGAFRWENTPEGMYYWAKRNTEFIRWFDYSWETEDKENMISKCLLFVMIFLSGMSLATSMVSAERSEWFLASALFVFFLGLAVFSIRKLKNE